MEEEKERGPPPTRWDVAREEEGTRCIRNRDFAQDRRGPRLTEQNIPLRCYSRNFEVSSVRRSSERSVATEGKMATASRRIQLVGKQSVGEKTTKDVRLRDRREGEKEKGGNVNEERKMWTERVHLVLEGERETGSKR